MNVNVIGWYNRKNIGDEAFRPAIDKIFKHHNVTYITPPQDHTGPDLVVLGGGAVASPYYLEKLPLKNAAKRYALGIDLAYESEGDLLAAAKFDGIYLRNKTDLDMWGGKFDCPVQSVPDLSFYLRPTGRDILGTLGVGETDRKKVAVFPTDYVNPAIDRPVREFGSKAWNFAENTAKELDAMIEAGWDVYLLCCSTGGYGDDRRVVLNIAAFMKYPVRVVLDTWEPIEMIDFIAQMDLTVCQRFHAHLFSVIAGTPLVSWEYTRKVRIFLEELGIKHRITGGRFDGERFCTRDMQAAVETACSTAADTSRDFLQVSAKNRNLLAGVIQTIRQEWLREPA